MPMSEQFRKRLYPLLPQIIEKFGTPFHIYDEQGIRDSLQRLKLAFSSQNLQFKEYFAVKALCKPAIMNIIKSEDCGFDCSSIPELRLARNAGGLPDDIMFTSNNTSNDEFAEALASGGSIINLDGIEFVEKILRVNGKLPKTLSFRLNPGLRKTGDEVNTIIGNPVDSKYGVPIEEIVAAFALAKQVNDQTGNIVEWGLHTMVCSNDLNYKHHVSTYKLLLDIAQNLYDNLGIKLSFVNIGGGIGTPYRLEEQEFNIEQLAIECAVLSRQFEEKNGWTPKIYMESGRWVTGPHGVLINRVINIYKKYKNFVGVEAAMPALMRPGMYGAYHHCTLLDSLGRPIQEGERPWVKVTVAGSICENCDVLARDIWLPEPRVGDLIQTDNTGAHGSVMCFNYNGRPRIQELLLKYPMQASPSVSRICRAETFEDLERRHQDLNGPEHLLKL